MRDSYDPPTDPAPWERIQGPQPPQPPQRPQPTRRSHPTWSFDGRYPEPPTRFDDGASEARSAGLRRLSKLTWRATQISAIAAVGFAALFSRTAQTHAAAATAAPIATPSPTPSPSPTHHRNRRAAATPSPTQAAPTQAAPTLAAPTTPPAPPPPPPSPTPVATSGGSGG